MPSAVSTTFTLTFPLLATDGTVSAPSYAFASTSNAGIWNKFGNVQVAQGGAEIFSVSSVNPVGMQMASSAKYCWGSGAPSGGSPDTGLGRNAAGVIEANNGTLGTFREVKVRSLISNAVTFANAAPTPVQGQIQAFTDSTVNTFGATIAGSGANKVLGWFNGTNWTVIGI